MTYKSKITYYEACKLTFIAADNWNWIIESMSTEYKNPDDENADECRGRDELSKYILTEA